MQCFGKILKGRGDTVFEFTKPDQSDICLCNLPKKFNKAVYLKPGSYVIVEQVVCDPKKEVKINYEVVEILFDKQIKHLKQKSLWPSAFEDKEATVKASALPPAESEEDEDEGKVSLKPNPNRKVFVESSSDSD